ncbi:MAG: fumarate reductase subunit FrdD [Pseudonocardiaceae bacterium]
MTKRSSEPFVWLLFSAGGMLTALLVPILLSLFGVLIPLGLVTPPSHEHLLSVLRYPPTRIVLLGLCVLALFHAAHRLNFILRDGLRLIQRSQVISRTCYGSAIIGSAFAGYILLRA